ncbi:hypothetical protein [Methylobacter tundripaludum]|uniref:hypothetical protein n=1 Tax=Methylobacter tundripaludum TaxID=173365 RepID=UPI001237915C|nr:hypothetical protein [Methylobacter tundripaludum]
MLTQLKPLIVKKYPLIMRLCWLKHKPSDFDLKDKLFHAFNSDDLDDNKINVNAIRFPDFSCNWDRFSKPISVRDRKNGSKNDGCFSITAEDSRYKDMATPCHDPLKEEKNYSHIEIRQLTKDENVFFEPPKKRKLEKEIQGWSRSQRLEYRMHLVNRLVREFEPLD